MSINGNRTGTITEHAQGGMAADPEIVKLAYQYAAETGRLDFISSLLGCVSLLMVFGGIFAWLNIRANAEKVAREAAEIKAEEVANLYLQTHLTSILESYEEFIRNHVGAVAADQIAQAQENGNNDAGRR